MGNSASAKYRLQSRSGFTLLELSLVLAILALLASGILSIMAQNSRRASQAELTKRMDAIEQALLNFRKINNRLPCPADSTRAVTDQYFGMESGDSGNCMNGAVAATKQLVTAGGTSVPSGDVPVRTLGLPDEYILDPWGGRFLYGVIAYMTASNAFTAHPLKDDVTRMAIFDAALNTRTTYAVYVLMSYGPNGHGAYQFNGVRKSFGSTNSNELTNCKCNSSAAYNSMGASFIQADPNVNPAIPTQGFDDILHYKLRSDLLSASEYTQ